MKFKNLGQEVSTGKNPPFKKGEAKPEMQEQESSYLRYGREYIESQGWEIAKSLKVAIEARCSNAAKVVSLREADIAARKGYDLNHGYVSEALILFGSFLSEGVVGEKDSIWDLREFYNRGIKFMKESYSTAAEDRQAKAKDALQVCSMKILVDRDLNMWPEEVDNGFAVELTRPEYMTFDQYDRAKKKRREVSGAL